MGKPNYISIIGFIGLISSIIFALIEIAFSELLRSLAESTNNSLITVLIFGGFLIAAIVAIIAALLGKDKVSSIKTVWIGSAIAFLLNLSLWTAIAYISTAKAYPELFNALSFGQKVLAFPTIYTTFALYIVGYYSLLWFIAGWTHAILYVCVLLLMNAKSIRMW